MRDPASEVVEVYREFRDYDGLDHEDAVLQTARVLGLEIDEVEDNLEYEGIYEKVEEKEKKKDDKKKSDDDDDDESDDDESDDKEEGKKKKKEDIDDDDELIVISEDTPIPGTEYVLEKGDKIKIISEDKGE